jgi:23S rRNA (uracil1939-C5)-methyltransferase
MPLIDIEKLAFGGSGFGRIDGKACFVPYTAPGDIAEISIAKDKSSFSEGVLKDLKKSSEFRTSPPCPVFGTCGGCDWQHIAYDEQCRQKELIFAETLWRIARVEASRIKPIHKAPSPFGYRQRIQLKVNATGGKLSVGFYRSGSHYVVDIPDRCEIAAPALNRALPEVRALVASCGEPQNVPQIDLVASSDDQASAIIHYIGDDKDRFSRYLDEAGKSLHIVRSLSLQTGRKSSLTNIFGADMVGYTVPCSNGGELELCFSPDSFSQVNSVQNRSIVSSVIDFCSVSGARSILDLYCGNGNFSLPVAGIAERIVGFEAYEKSVSFANYNAECNGITNAGYFCRDAAEGVDEIIGSGGLFDMVIIDPPRSGAREIVSKLARIASPHVIYISCDPPTLSRDLATLKKSGFEVVSVQPVDMFPQTYHLESITLLKKGH